MSAKIISFATQKGGSGKSTMLMLTAAAFHNRTGKKVLVIDCDPQKSVKDIYKAENQESGNDSYDVIAYNWNQPKPEVNFQKTLAIAEKKFDLIFLDAPGKVEGKEVYFSILISDIVVVPLVASALDIKATIRFLRTIPVVKEVKEKQGFSLEVFGVINKKDNTVEHQRLVELAGIGGLQVFDSSLSNLVRYKRGISTIHDITDPKLREDEFNTYFEEFRKKCKV
ncbi:MAG: ParA family protein [Flammeovirgaceae bacterium]|nr:ParA family protein [Flammeovirgaceae bacterium]